VQYHLIHAVALLALSLSREKTYESQFMYTRQNFAAGIVLFSGSLYGLALGGPRWLEAVTAMGEWVLFVGWANLAFLGSQFWGSQSL
jgi:uncharacterized membrane protein YgdD (TMEM256/DUF423 family)